MVSLHHDMTVYIDKFRHMDGVFQALDKKKTHWKEDLYFALKFARPQLSKCNVEVTAETSMLLDSARILDPFRKLPSFWNWEKGMDINPEDETC